MLVELARHDVNPSKIWTESFGHTLAQLGRKREGRSSMYAVSAQLLRRFLTANELRAIAARSCYPSGHLEMF